MKFIPMEGQPIYRVSSSSSYTNVLVLTKKLEDVLKKQQRFGLLLIQEITWGDKYTVLESRDILTSWLWEHNTEMSMYCLGLAIVMSNQKEPILYGYPRAVFYKEGDALEWLQLQIKYYGNKWALTNF